MKAIVTKKFFDPFLKRIVKPNEAIDIPDELVENYSQYIQKTEPIYIKIEQPELVDDEEKPKKKRR